MSVPGQGRLKLLLDRLSVGPRQDKDVIWLAFVDRLGGQHRDVVPRAEQPLFPWIVVDEEAQYVAELEGALWTLEMIEASRIGTEDDPHRTWEEVAQALGQARLMMWLLGIFAGVALLLASIGIYGAVAYTVEQRTGEIGVRMALGAQTADVLRLVVRQGMAPVVLGLVIGIVAALALGRLLTTQLYEVSPHNPALLAITALTLGAVALLACFLPARRATFVNPIEALRAE